MNNYHCTCGLVYFLLGGNTIFVSFYYKEYLDDFTEIYLMILGGVFIIASFAYCWLVCHLPPMNDFVLRKLRLEIHDHVSENLQVYYKRQFKKLRNRFKTQFKYELRNELSEELFSTHSRFFGKDDCIKENSFPTSVEIISHKHSSPLPPPPMDIV